MVQSAHTCGMQLFHVDTGDVFHFRRQRTSPPSIPFYTACFSSLQLMCNFFIIPYSLNIIILFLSMRRLPRTRHRSSSVTNSENPPLLFRVVLTPVSSNAGGCSFTLLFTTSSRNGFHIFADSRPKNWRYTSPEWSISVAHSKPQVTAIIFYDFDSQNNFKDFTPPPRFTQVFSNFTKCACISKRPVFSGYSGCNSWPLTQWTWPVNQHTCEQKTFAIFKLTEDEIISRTLLRNSVSSHELASSSSRCYNKNLSIYKSTIYFWTQLCRMFKNELKFPHCSAFQFSLKLSNT